MKRQRVHNEAGGGYGYGYNNFGVPGPATGSGAAGLSLAAAGMGQMRSGHLQDSTLQHGMQFGMQPNLPGGMGGMSNLNHSNGLHSALPPDLSGTRFDNNFGAVGMGVPSALGHSLGSGLTSSNVQSQVGKHMGQNMGGSHTMAPDMGPGILHSIGSGGGQNMMHNMGNANLSLGSNMSNPNLSLGSMASGGLEAQGGLSQAMGQGMGISEGFPCVKLRGLPFDAIEQDIAVWLETEPLDIIIVRRGQRSTGEAFVLLRMPIQVELVLRKNKTYIGKRYVEVTLAKKLDFYKAVFVMVRDDAENNSAPSQSHDRHHRDHVPRHASPVHRRHSSKHSSRNEGSSRHRSIEANGSSDYEDHLLPSQKVHTGVLKMRGLPFAATPEDIVYWFNSSGLPIARLNADSVHIVMNSSGKPTGNGYVQFGSAEESKAAMAKDRKTLGSRYIELFPCSQEELAEAA